MADTITSCARAPGLAAPELAASPAAGLASLGAAGAAPAGLTAVHKDEARELGSGAGFRGQGTAEGADCPGAALDEQDAGKRFATRWGMPRELASLDAVAEFADRTGAPQ